MLTGRLQCAQKELHLHRRWLQAFLGTGKRPYTTTSHPLIQRNDLPRIALSRCSQPKSVGYASFASKKKLKIRKHGLWKTRDFEPPVRQVPDESIQALLRQRESLRQAVADLRIQDVPRLYAELEDKSVFNRHDFRMIAQCVHQSCRGFVQKSNDPRERREETDQLVAFGEQLVKDVQTGVLQPNPAAHVHLLSFFKEAGHRDPGLKFWKWLEGQDESFVSPDVYGAAIELLAVTGSTLPDLEELYQKALFRSPGNFAAYHLSPDAIVPNRDEAVRLPGLPMSLLQGIVTARLLLGDTRNAYLAMDTALRLYPDQTPARFFTLFLEERPLVESYTILAIACRAGIVLPVNVLKRFQSAIRQTSDSSSLLRHSLAVRAQISLLYMHTGAGGRLTKNMLNEIIVSLTQFLRLSGASTLCTTQRQGLVNGIMAVIRTIVGIFARFRITPSIAAFNSMIVNLAGYGRSEQVIGVALSDAQALGFEANEVTRRSILVAAGMIGKKEFVLESWRKVVQARLDAKESADGSDWHCFIQAARRANCIDDAREEFAVLKESLPEDKHAHVLSQLEASGTDYASPNQPSDLSVDAISAELEKIRKDLQIIDAHTKDAQGAQDFSSLPLPMTLLSDPREAGVPEIVAMELYNELTTELAQATSLGDNDGSNFEANVLPPSSKPTRIGVVDPGAPHRMTQTSIPLGKLRYENWKTMNWLLEQSATNDQAYLTLVDDAIAAGTVPPLRKAVSGIGSANELESYGLSDVSQKASSFHQEQKLSAEEVQAWRVKVLSLRGKAG